MSSVYTNYHQQINQCFNAVEEECDSLIDTLTIQTQAAMKEIIQTHDSWIQDTIMLGQMVEHRDYLCHFYKESDDLETVTANSNVDAIFDRVQFLPHLVYELIALGAPKPSNIALVDLAIQKLVLKTIRSFRRALLASNFDSSRVEDRLQDASVELLRAARTYRNVGHASFITYAWRRVMVQVNRKQLHSQLVVKVSNREVEKAFRTVEINSEKTTQLSVTSFLPNAVEVDDDEVHCPEYATKPQLLESPKFQRNVRAKLIALLNTLKPHEKIVVLSESGLFGDALPSFEIAQEMGLSRSSYSHAKIRMLKKLGFYKELDPKWFSVVTN